jgi:hypothetical protein
VLRNIPPAEAGTFLETFGGLPEGCQTEIFRELALTADANVRHATADQVALFASTPEGKAIVEESLCQPARDVGIIRTRIERILARLHPEEIEAAVAWFDGLPPSHAAAIYPMLAL